MTTEDQADVIACLGAPKTHGGASVERIETHSAIVFLAGERAWKLKRAVRYDYLDFSTAARRKALCEAELHLNRRTAPEIYLDVAAVTREHDGSLALRGGGTPVDWVIEMRRFDQALLFDHLAARGGLALDVMAPLGQAIARFHQSAEPRHDHGGRAGMRWVIDGNAAGFAEQGGGILSAEVCARVAGTAERELERVAPLLDQRRDAGLVRQCHGDLHLRNIVLLDGRPTLFDAVEFNDEIACTDVLYDVAFLLMDLWHRELPGHANAVLNGYLAETSDLQGLTLMPLFLSCRAAVRAKTSATAARLQSDAVRAGELEQLSREYLEMADRLLRPPRSAVIAVGGFSGSGKSVLARALAPSIGPVPGAVVVRSDEVRKRLCGVPPLLHLGSDGYTRDVSERVYATLIEQATTAIRAGHAVIVDAVHARSEDRQRIERAAAEQSVPFTGLWLEAPEATLIERTGRRQLDPSDADAEVIRMQRSQETGRIDWYRLDASAPAEDVLRAAQRKVVAAARARRRPAHRGTSRTS